MNRKTIYRLTSFFTILTMILASAAAAEGGRVAGFPVAVFLVAHPGQAGERFQGHRAGVEAVAGFGEQLGGGGVVAVAGAALVAGEGDPAFGVHPVAAVAQAQAEVRRAAAVATEQEMKARVHEMRARVVEKEALVPEAMADAFRSGNLGVMDYLRMKNLQADTGMRTSIGGAGESEGDAAGKKK